MNKNEFELADQRLLERSKQALDRSIEDLDGATMSRLNQIRRQALATTRAPQWRWWIPASGLATACALLVAVNLSRQQTGAPGALASPLTDLELLASNENLEMLEELEFYAWLETELEG